MKVCAVSPFERATSKDILSFLEMTQAELVVLPGVFKKNTPSPLKAQRRIRSSVAVLVEYGAAKGRSTPYLVTSGGAKSMPHQIFGQSPTAKEIDKLVAAWEARTFLIGSRKVTFIICGEVNGFNPDGSTKHKRVLPSFDILANPTHSVMGRWQHLGRKLSTLSKGRAVIHVANNTKNSENLRTDLRIYKDGVLVNEDVPKAKNKEHSNLKAFECEI